MEVGRVSTPSRLGRVRTVALGGSFKTERRVLLREMWAMREERLAWKGARTSLSLMVDLDVLADNVQKGADMHSQDFYGGS